MSYRILKSFYNRSDAADFASLLSDESVSLQTKTSLKSIGYSGGIPKETYHVIYDNKNEKQDDLLLLKSFRKESDAKKWANKSKLKNVTIEYVPMSDADPMIRKYHPGDYHVSMNRTDFMTQFFDDMSEATKSVFRVLKADGVVQPTTYSHLGTDSEAPAKDSATFQGGLFDDQSSKTKDTSQGAPKKGDQTVQPNIFDTFDYSSEQKQQQGTSSNKDGQGVSTPRTNIPNQQGDVYQWKKEGNNTFVTPRGQNQAAGSLVGMSGQGSAVPGSPSGTLGGTISTSQSSPTSGTLGGSSNTTQNTGGSFVDPLAASLSGKPSPAPSGTTRDLTAEEMIGIPKPKPSQSVSTTPKRQQKPGDLTLQEMIGPMGKTGPLAIPQPSGLATTPSTDLAIPQPSGLATRQGDSLAQYAPMDDVSKLFFDGRSPKDIQALPATEKQNLMSRIINWGKKVGRGANKFVIPAITVLALAGTALAPGVNVLDQSGAIPLNPNEISYSTGGSYYADGENPLFDDVGKLIDSGSPYNNMDLGGPEGKSGPTQSVQQSGGSRSIEDMINNGINIDEIPRTRTNIRSN